MPPEILKVGSLWIWQKQWAFRTPHPPPQAYVISAQATRVGERYYLSCSLKHPLAI